MRYASALVIVLFLISGITVAHAAKPWDLIIKAQFEQSQIEPSQKPVIYGTVQDQIGKPVSGAQVRIAFADNSATVITNGTGYFRQEFGEQDSEGVFSVKVSATLNDLKGYATTTLKVGDEYSTFGDIYYSKNFDKNKQSKSDPYFEMKQKQYQKYVEEQNKRKEKQYEIEAKKLAQKEKQDDSIQRRNEAVNSTQVGAGIYSGKDYDKYIAKTDPRIKDITVAQMSYTKQVYEEAKYAMKKIIDAGGSLADAKKAYFDKLATPQDTVEKIGSANNTENHSKMKKHSDPSVNSKKVKGLKYNKNLK